MPLTQGQKPIRVAQWATGTVGAFALRAVIDHPGMELVGVRVYSEAKNGKDAGEICGYPATGIKATRSLDAILAAKPDCVVYMPDRTDMDDVCRLLENGVNIVTTRAEFFNPDMMAPELRARIEAACSKGNASIHATGSSPGFITEALPIVLASLSRRLDFLGVDEYANCLEGCSEEMLTELMGFGDTPEAFAQRHNPEHFVFEHSLGLFASAVGLPIERFETTVEPAFCREPTRLHKSTIAAGTIGAMRVAITGFHKGNPLVRFRSNWFVTKNVEPSWNLRNDGWTVSVQGDTPIEMTIDLPMPVEQSMRASARYTAHRPVNAIAAVCAARAGIIPTTALGQVVAQFG
jgi:4-hydroxy-tetrahydrodipicolinate reductase